MIRLLYIISSTEDSFFQLSKALEFLLQTTAAPDATELWREIMIESICLAGRMMWRYDDVTTFWNFLQSNLEDISRLNVLITKSSKFDLSRCNNSLQDEDYYKLHNSYQWSQANDIVRNIVSQINRACRAY